MALANCISSLSFLSLALACGAGPAPAQDTPPSIALADEGLKEIYRPGAQISGSVFAGLLVRDHEAAGTVLGGYVPSGWKAAPICSRIISIDGHYQATALYDVPEAWPGGIARLAFPTEYADLLEGATGDALAVSVSPGPCGEGVTEVVSLALWNTSELAQVDLLLNAFRADSVFVYINDADPPVRCAPVDHAGRTAYDTKCSLDLKDLGGIVTLDVYRVVDGKPAGPDRLTVHLPGG